MEHKGQTVNLGDTQGRQNGQGADVDGKGSDSVLPIARDLTPPSSVFVFICQKVTFLTLPISKNQLSISHEIVRATSFHCEISTNPYRLLWNSLKCNLLVDLIDRALFSQNITEKKTFLFHYVISSLNISNKFTKCIHCTFITQVI